MQLADIDLSADADPAQDASTSLSAGCAPPPGD
jgi:hypothetical protein